MKKLLAIAASLSIFCLAGVQGASAQVMKISKTAVLDGHTFDCAGGGGCTIYQVDGLGTEIDFGNGESYLLFDDGTLEGAP